MKFVTYDPVQYLTTTEDIAAYLTAVIQENDPDLLATALGDIARARGMTRVSQEAGITREALYKALRPGSTPRFDTIHRVCQALDLQLIAQPKN